MSLGRKSQIVLCTKLCPCENQLPLDAGGLGGSIARLPSRFCRCDLCTYLTIGTAGLATVLLVAIAQRYAICGLANADHSAVPLSLFGFRN